MVKRDIIIIRGVEYVESPEKDIRGAAHAKFFNYLTGETVFLVEKPEEEDTNQ